MRILLCEFGYLYPCGALLIGCQLALSGYRNAQPKPHRNLDTRQYVMEPKVPAVTIVERQNQLLVEIKDDKLTHLGVT